MRYMRRCTKNVFIRLFLTSRPLSTKLNETNPFRSAVQAAEKLVLPSAEEGTRDPFSIVSYEMSNLAKLIANLIGSGNHVLNRVSSYYFEGEGKNVRPLIVLLLSKSLAEIPVHQKNRIPIDELDTNDQKSYEGTDSSNTIAGKSVDDSITPLSILRGINPKVSLDPLSKPMNELPKFRSINGIFPKQRRLAEIIEMIHTASLLHDDVIDFSDSRRGRPSGNTAFTNKMSVLAGDFLLARASVAIARLRNPEVIELLSSTIANLVEGEFMQLKNTVINREDLDVIVNDGDVKRIPKATGKIPVKQHEYSVQLPKIFDHESTVDAAFEYYLHKTYLKTASLISKLSRAAAILSGAQDNVIEDCYQFGRNLGLCFQIVDDMLDYTSTEKEFGKPSQADLKLGLATAPILYAWKEEPKLGPMITRKFSKKGDVKTALEAVRECRGLQKTKELSEKYCLEALKYLHRLPESESRNALESVTKSVLVRSK